ncbi:MAG: hypothetical protein Q9196_000491 [Gyalolechia fulgens]
MSVAVVDGASPTLLRTISNDITLEFALEEEHDLLRKLTYWNKRLAFAGYLRSHSDEIEAVIAFHLGLTDSGSCRLAPTGAWVHGSFNMCVPAYVKGWERCAEKRVMIRFPLPYKVGEEEVPGNAEEKLRCEAATYAWIQDNCPEIPIVRLLGFSFADDQCNTADAGSDHASRILNSAYYHDSRLRHQPNSINDDKDCRAQMAAITGMRAVLPHLIQRDTRQGPFSLSLTDLHQSNIYVDKDWHITRIIDLEWACSLPIQMQTPPYWLTSLKVDELNGENLVEYNKVLEEFMEAFEGEEMLHLQQGLYGGQDTRPRTSIMRDVWESGAAFYFYALESTTGLLFLWGRNIKPIYSKVSYLDDEANKVLAAYWSGDMEDTMVAKLQDRETYLEQLQKLFEAKAESPAT